MLAAVLRLWRGVGDLDQVQSVLRQWAQLETDGEGGTTERDALLKTAVDLGHRGALGLWLVVKGKRPLSGIEILARERDQGCVWSLARLGDCYASPNRMGMHQDLPKAVRVYQRAVADGDIAATFRLAVCLEHGRGVERDADAALAMYLRAAELGVVAARRRIGDEMRTKDSAVAADVYLDIGDVQRLNLLSVCTVAAARRRKAAGKARLPYGEKQDKAADVAAAARPGTAQQQDHGVVGDVVGLAGKLADRRATPEPHIDVRVAAAAPHIARFMDKFETFVTVLSKLQAIHQDVTAAFQLLTETREAEVAYKDAQELIARYAAHDVVPEEHVQVRDDRRAAFVHKAAALAAWAETGVPTLRDDFMPYICRLKPVDENERAVPPSWSADLDNALQAQTNVCESTQVWYQQVVQVAEAAFEARDAAGRVLAQALASLGHAAASGGNGQQLKADLARAAAEFEAAEKLAPLMELVLPEEDGRTASTQAATILSSLIADILTSHVGLATRGKLLGVAKHPDVIENGELQEALDAVHRAEDDLHEQEKRLARTPGGHQRQDMVAAVDRARTELRKVKRLYESLLFPAMATVIKHFPELRPRIGLPDGKFASFAESDGLVVPRCLADYAPDQTLLAIAGQGVAHSIHSGTAPDGTQVALKEFLNADGDDFIRELSTLSRLRHPCVVQVRSAFFDESRQNSAFLEMPRYAGGSLTAWLQAGNGRSLAAKKHVLNAVARGLEHCHGRGVVHCDVKPDNIFLSSIDDDASAVLGDFDVSRSNDGRIQSMRSTIAVTAGGLIGTLGYMAPELHLPGTAARKLRTSIDVYAFGVTLCETLTGKMPKVSARHLAKTPKVDGDFDETAADLVKRIFVADPAKRPSMAEVLASPFFALHLAPRDTRDCGICSDDFDLHLGGAVCPSGHALCGDCLHGFVTSQVNAIADAEMFKGTDDAGGLVCFSGGCRLRLDDHQLVNALSADGVDKFLHLRTAAVERRVVKDQHEIMEQRLKQVRSQNIVDQHVRHVVEEILVLRCPACRMAFIDFTGCLALTCANGDCRRAFCALCQAEADCGRDAHRHAAMCELNPEFGQVFIALPKWQAVVEEKKRRKIRAYLKGVNGEEQRRQILERLCSVVPEIVDGMT